jgi:hypothetical protein
LLNFVARPAALAILCFLLPSARSFPVATGSVSGQVTDPQGKPVSAAAVRLNCDANRELQTATDAEGHFAFPSLPDDACQIFAEAPGFTPATQKFVLRDSQVVTINLQFSAITRRADTLTVTASLSDLDIEHPDPSERINIRQDILDANPGRPGAPVSLPGLPIETASGGIKAPQYFAPGVAGDHGEPIAQFLLAGSYLVPNNLSANAHGNGYADPNIMVPAIIESVETDGGAFNVREGNHAVNLAATYEFRPRLEPFVTLTADYRDLDLAAGWSPSDPATHAWIALQASYGNGFLDTLEHRRQFKLNAFRVFQIGRHEITLFGIGYYAQSKIPGLVPIGVPDLHDTIDPRQRDQTHTGELVLNDVWRISPSAELQLSGFFRTYNLALYSNFGDGLIRQSEFRTETGGNLTYIRKLTRHLSLMAGLDSLREAPRRLDLDRYEPFQSVTANNVTINFLSPYVAIDGRPTSWLRYNLAWRRDQIGFDNTDLLHASNSYQKWSGVNSPKATIGLLPPERIALPSLSFSFGQTFFTNDPRIGTGLMPGTPVSRAHSFQLVVAKTILGTDLRVTLGRVTQEQSLAKIDPDTGLQYDQGPSRNRYITVSARRYFRAAMIQASVSKADARDMLTGLPLPEAPRLIVDFLGAFDRLPFQLHARAEWEEVGRNPLGDGFVSIPVREFRGALTRQFGKRLQAGINFLIATGYTGQTIESDELTGVRIPSYATLSFNYRLGR